MFFDASKNARERIMIETKAQRGIICAPTIWQAAITAIMILLLCVPPAWAATICNCEAATGSLHACCQAAENEADMVASSPCKTTPSSVVNSLVRKSSPPAMSCCEAPPQRELEEAGLLPTVTIAAEENYPPPVHVHKQNPLTHSVKNNSPRQQQRPLYLALSCWLI